MIFDERDVEDVEVRSGVSLGENGPAFSLVQRDILSPGGIMADHKPLGTSLKSATSGLESSGMMTRLCQIGQFLQIRCLMVKNIHSPDP